MKRDTLIDARDANQREWTPELIDMVLANTSWRGSSAERLTRAPTRIVEVAGHEFTVVACPGKSCGRRYAVLDLRVRRQAAEASGDDVRLDDQDLDRRELWRHADW